MKETGPRPIVQLSRFAVVGVINTLVDLAVLNVETLATGIKDGPGYALQKGVSFAVAVACSYILNKRWTFEDSSRRHQGRKFSRFVVVSLLGAAVNVGTATVVATNVKGIVGPTLDVPILTDQVWVNVGALCGTCAGFLWNFLGYKFLVFKR